MASPGKKAYLLRVDPQLFDAIARWADDEVRSVNGQIEHLLDEALRRAGRKPAAKRAAQRRAEQASASAHTSSALGPKDPPGPALPPPISQPGKAP